MTASFTKFQCQENGIKCFPHNFLIVWDIFYKKGSVKQKTSNSPVRKRIAKINRLISDLS